MSIKAGVGFSTEKDTLRACTEALQIASINLQKDKIDLAIIFTSLDFVYSKALKTVKALLGPTTVLGGSSAAIICENGVFRYGLVIVLMSFLKEIYYNTAYIQDIASKGCLVAGKELAKRLLSDFRGSRRDLGIIFSDGLINEGSALIYGLQEKFGRSFPIVGASVSDNLLFQRTYLYYNETIITDAALGMLLGGRLGFGYGVRHGWNPLGKPHIVTKSKGNVVFEIDGAPAVQLYQDYLGLTVQTLKKELRRISVLYPIGIYISGEEEYLLRNLIAIKDDGAIIFQGDVPIQSQIRLMIGTKESCLDATRQAAEEAKTGLRGSGYNPSLVFIFDSVSRYVLLRNETKKELDIVKETFGKDIPVIGLYTYGEQAPLKTMVYQGQTHFHNQTITILTLGG
ncbi:MAG: FIST C-terminal domain-containing protein [Candidatus Omnitrophica bacterium]|nr:FIST C-terminal domain-containing protein [Candidatus Omnitrophota bacterium]